VESRSARRRWPPASEEQETGRGRVHVATMGGWRQLASAAAKLQAASECHGGRAPLSCSPARGVPPVTASEASGSRLRSYRGAVGAARNAVSECLYDCCHLQTKDGHTLVASRLCIPSVVSSKRSCQNINCS
jgi:hypothetical protein